MNKEYIDVKYREITENDSENNGNENVEFNPVSTLFRETISGFCGTVNRVTDSIKEYNMCKQQEETKRAEIKANLKLSLAQIETQKEIIIQQLCNQHEIKLKQIDYIHEMALKELETSLNAVSTAVEIAKETRDFSMVISLMEISNKIVDARSAFTLELMDRSNFIDTSLEKINYLE